MRIKLACAFWILQLSGSFNGFAWAEVALKDNTEILGKWMLESVAPGLEKPKIQENRTWEFRADGVVVTSGYNRHFKRDDSQQFTYTVTDGKIRAEDAGRPGKYLEYAIYEKSGDSMILKGGMEGFYFFKKK
jgi:hypothetical protein